MSERARSGRALSSELSGEKCLQGFLSFLQKEVGAEKLEGGPLKTRMRVLGSEYREAEEHGQLEGPEPLTPMPLRGFSILAVHQIWCGVGSFLL